MHAHVGRYQVKPGTLDDSPEKARKDLLPRMRALAALDREGSPTPEELAAVDARPGARLRTGVWPPS